MRRKSVGQRGFTVLDNVLNPNFKKNVSEKKVLMYFSSIEMNNESWTSWSCYIRRWRELNCFLIIFTRTNIRQRFWLRRTHRGPWIGFAIGWKGGGESEQLRYFPSQKKSISNKRSIGNVHAILIFFLSFNARCDVPFMHAFIEVCLSHFLKFLRVFAQTNIASLKTHA